MARLGHDYLTDVLRTLIEGHRVFSLSNESASGAHHIARLD